MQFTKQAFPTKDERDEALVEELKFHVITDLRTLQARIGHDQAREWLKEEWMALPF